MLKVFVARNESDVVGYCTMFIHQHPHQSNEHHAIQDALYLKPNMRGAGAGEAFVEFIDRHLALEGVATVYRGVTPSFDYSKTLGRLGYKESEVLYERRMRSHGLDDCHL